VVIGCFSTPCMALPQHAANKPASGTSSQTSASQNRAFLFHPEAGDDEVAPPVPIHRARSVNKRPGKHPGSRKKQPQQQPQSLSGLLFDWFHV